MTHLSPGRRVSGQMTCTEWRSRTHQDDLLNVFGRAPVKHPRGVIFLYVLVHALNLLVSQDEEWVMSNQTKRWEGESEIISLIWTKNTFYNHKNIWQSANRSLLLKNEKEKKKVAFFLVFPASSFRFPVRGHLQKCQQNCHVIKQSDISSGSQAEEDGSNTLRWLAWARRCNYAPLLHTAFDVVRCVVKALTDQTLNISAICPTVFAFQSEGY